MRRFILTLAGCLAASSACAADWDQFLQAGFGVAASKDGSVCYARVYDAGHLAANKAQRIRDVAIKLTLRTENGERRLDHNLVTHLVGSRQKYWSGGQCGDYRGLVARCFVEGDGGAADFTLDSDGKTLTARFNDFHIWRPQDAADESSVTIDKSPSDKVAKLTKAPMSACAGTGD
ncbi:MAG: hypothetical protein KDJ44_13010 [Rhodoblastus sp.]|nr:hypothetical protein [Rhodoblastus sp.]